MRSSWSLSTCSYTIPTFEAAEPGPAHSATVYEYLVAAVQHLQDLLDAFVLEDWSASVG